MRRKHLVGKKRSPCDSSASFKRNLFFTLIENFLIFWHFDYEKMWSTCNIYELYSLINCLRNHQHQGLSYLSCIKKNKSLLLLSLFSSLNIPLMLLLLDVTGSGSTYKLYCFAILRVCIFPVSRGSWRHHKGINFVVGDLVLFLI